MTDPNDSIFSGSRSDVWDDYRRLEESEWEEFLRDRQQRERVGRNFASTPCECGGVGCPECEPELVA